MQTKPVISPEQVEAFWRDGYVAVHDVLSEEEVERLRRRADDILLGVVDFPRDQMEAEPELGKPLAVDRRMGIRKIRNLTTYDPVFAELLEHPKVIRIATAVLGPDVKLLTGQMLCKPARFGSAKPYHRDAPKWALDPDDILTLWIALDDATLQNGCMRFLKGSHRSAPGVDLDEEAIEVKAGSGTLHHSQVLHETSDNRTAHRRRAMTLVFAKATAKWRGEEPHPEFPLVAGQSHEGCI